MVLAWPTQKPGHRPLSDPKADCGGRGWSVPTAVSSTLSGATKYPNSIQNHKFSPKHHQAPMNAKPTTPNSTEPAQMHLPSLPAPCQEDSAPPVTLTLRQTPKFTLTSEASKVWSALWAPTHAHLRETEKDLLHLPPTHRGGQGHLVSNSHGPRTQRGNHCWARRAI